MCVCVCVCVADGWESESIFIFICFYLNVKEIYGKEYSDVILVSNSLPKQIIKIVLPIYG